MSDLIDRQAAIDALWKVLYEYEDKTEKQFQESDELDISEWILHRIFVQNMSDIDRQTILDAPTIDAVEVVRCKNCVNFSASNSFTGKCTLRGDYIFTNDFCSYAVERRTDADE